MTHDRATLLAWNAAQQRARDEYAAHMADLEAIAEERVKPCPSCDIDIPTHRNLCDDCRDAALRARKAAAARRRRKERAA